MNKVRSLLLVALGASLSARVAHAESAVTRACIVASERGQVLRGERRLIEASGQFALCSSAGCPEMVRQDCSTWMRDALDLVPSVVVAARDERQRDLVAVRVIVDGAAVTERLDGRPIALDPGEHDFRFEADGATPVEQRILLHVKEKGRPLAVTLLPSPAPPAATPPAATTSAGEHSLSLTLLLSGVAVASGAGAIYFDLRATSDARDLRTSCAPSCNPSDVDSARSKYVVAAALGGAALLSLGAAASLFFGSRDTGSAIGFSVGPCASGVESGLVGRF